MKPLHPDLREGLAFAIGLLLCLFVVSAAACFSKPASYGVQLEECNRTAQTLQESIDCENKVRAAYGRFPRDAGGDR